MNNKQMFDSIAKRYDLLNKLISLGLDSYWRDSAIAVLSLKPGGSCLDIGCGTGDLSIELVKKDPSVSVTGIDPSEEMLKIAEEKINKFNASVRHPESPTKPLLGGDKLHEGSRLKFVNASATDIPFNSESYDGAICGFCIRNIKDREKALKETFRVLKHGSRLVILELSYPKNAIVKLGYMFFTSVFIPLAALVLSKKEAYAYLLTSIKEFPKPPEFLELMRNSGFKNCKSIPLSLGIVTIYKAEK